MTTDGDSSEAFCEDVEPKIRVALTATFGARAGREAAVDALSYGWEQGPTLWVRSLMD